MLTVVVWFDEGVWVVAVSVIWIGTLMRTYQAAKRAVVIAVE